MDKKLVLAVAGSGKTTLLIDKLNLSRRTIILTYTNQNADNLRSNIVDKFGYVPDNICIETYFTFVYRFCLLPFSCNIKRAGINYSHESARNAMRLGKQSNGYYFDKDRRIYSARIAEYCMTNYKTQIKNRIEKYADCIYVDEFQDFGGYDYNFMVFVSKCNIEFLAVGDFWQHTFSTSNVGGKNRTLYDNYDAYINRNKSNDLSIDTNTLSKSWRCPESICRFVSNNLGVSICSYSKISGSVSEIDDNQIDRVMNDTTVLKLFYNNAKRYSKFNAMNWGNFKGITHKGDVCVVLNDGTYKKYKDKEMNLLPSGTKSKLYVACTRPTRNLFLVAESKIKKYKQV